jgi:hypothetical protein
MVVTHLIGQHHLILICQQHIAQALPVEHVAGLTRIARLDDHVVKHLWEGGQALFSSKSTTRITVPIPQPQLHNYTTMYLRCTFPQQPNHVCKCTVMPQPCTGSRFSQGNTHGYVAG